MVPGSSNPHKYIPLHTTARPRLWWHPISVDIPSSYASVTIVNKKDSSTLDKETTPFTTTTLQQITEDETTYTTLDPIDETSTIPYDEDYFNSYDETAVTEEPSSTSYFGIVGA